MMYMDSKEFVLKYREAANANKSLTEFATSLGRTRQWAYERRATLKRKGVIFKPLRNEGITKPIDPDELNKLMESAS